MSDADTQKMLKNQANRALKVVFKIMFRLSQNMESDKNYFSLEFYCNIVYSNQIFDLAKLFDIAAIYGSSNREQVAALMNNVFENDVRYQ